MKIILLLSALVLAGCATSSAQVVSSSGGPTITAAQAEPYNGVKQRIAVSSFDARGAGLGQGLSDMLVDALVNSNRFIVLERERLNEVTAEQGEQTFGREFDIQSGAPVEIEVLTAAK